MRCDSFEPRTEENAEVALMQHSSPDSSGDKWQWDLVTWTVIETTYMAYKSRQRRSIQSAWRWDAQTLLLSLLAIGLIVLVVAAMLWSHAPAP